jgi:hypothetical protein
MLYACMFDGQYSICGSAGQTYHSDIRNHLIMSSIRRMSQIKAVLLMVCKEPAENQQSAMPTSDNTSAKFRSAVDGN